MKFSELEEKMRVFETTNDRCVLPNIYIVARLDGRHFHTLTKETGKFEAPFDEKFRDLMTATVEHLMKDSGFNFIYGYTQSDEISLLFNSESNDFARKVRKLNSILAGEASAKFSLLFGDLGVFDCRLCELVTQENVIDYFRWRNEDACRNALNAWCYWTLRKEGENKQTATKKLEGLSFADKNELLFQRGINFNDLPEWQKRGIGFYWKLCEKNGSIKRELRVDMNLPKGDSYKELIQRIL